MQTPSPEAMLTESVEGGGRSATQRCATHRGQTRAMPAWARRLGEVTPMPLFVCLPVLFSSLARESHWPCAAAEPEAVVPYKVKQHQFCSLLLCLTRLSRISTSFTHPAPCCAKAPVRGVNTHYFATHSTGANTMALRTYVQHTHAPHPCGWVVPWPRDLTGVYKTYCTPPSTGHGQ